MGFGRVGLGFRFFFFLACSFPTAGTKEIPYQDEPLCRGLGCRGFGPRVLGFWACWFGVGGLATGDLLSIRELQAFSRKVPMKTYGNRIKTHGNPMKTCENLVEDQRRCL